MHWFKRNWIWLQWPVALSLLGYLAYENRDAFSRLTDRRIQWASYLFAFVLALTNVLLSFYRWYLLVWAQGFPFRVRDAFRIGFVGYVLHLVGMGAIGGDIARSLLIAKEQDSRQAVAVATILFDRFLGLLSLLMVGACAGLFQTALIEQSGELRLVAGLLWGGSLGSLLGLGLFLQPATSRWAFLQRMLRLPLIGVHMSELVAGIGLYQQKRRIVLAALAVSLVGNFCGLSAYYFCAQALQVGSAAPGLSAHLLLIPGAVVAEVLAPLPGGLGALEAAVQYCYIVANAAAATPLPTKSAAEAGFLTALALRFLTLVVSVIGVGYYVTARKDLERVSSSLAD